MQPKPRESHQSAGTCNDAPTSHTWLDEELTFASIAERDVELLLFEELRCSEGFQRWLLGQSLPALDAVRVEELRLLRILHSLPSPGDGAGETDIVAVFKVSTTDTRIVLLIENKIDAQFQPNQGERYQLRKQALIAEHTCQAAVCILVAPEEYLELSGNATLFDVCVSYEDMISYLQQRSKNTSHELGRRLNHRCEVLDCAIKRYRRGYQAHPDATMTSFWVAHYERIHHVAPTLTMHHPGAHPAGSHWIYFNESLPKMPELPAVDLCNKMKVAQVQLTFHAWATHIETVRQVLQPTLDTEMRIDTARNAIVLAVPVPRLDLTRPADEQYEAIDAALQAANQLKDWYICNQKRLVELAATIDAN
jgi:hypothetical protein